MRYRNVIFDLDGTLTDSGEGIKNSAKYAFARLGLPVPEDGELRKMVGPPLSVGFSVLGVREEQVSEAVRLYRLRYNEGGGKYENRVYDGVEDCLNALKAAGLKLFVGTSKPEPLAREILSDFHLAPYFDYIAGASWDKSRQNKDDVLAYLLSVVGGADGTVMVGDTHYDVRGAHARGLPCVGVSWGYGTRKELREAGADALIDTPEELLTYLLWGGTHMNEQTNRDSETLIAFWDQALKLSDADRAEAGQAGPEDYMMLAPAEKPFLAAQSLGGRSKVLDYGCGLGWAAIAAAKAGCKDVTAVDPAAGAVESAAFCAALFGVADRVHTETIPVDWLKTVPDGTYDGFISINVLDVVPPEVAETIVREAARIVTKDAVVIFGMNYYMTPERAAEKGEELVDGCRVYQDGVLRLVSRTDAEWEAAFAPYFAVERLEYYAWPGEEQETRRLYFLRKH